MNWRTCNRAKSADQNKGKKHDCRVNWGGSSKAMESNLAVEMLNTIKDSTFQVSTMIGK